MKKHNLNVWFTQDEWNFIKKMTAKLGCASYAEFFRILLRQLREGK